METDGTERGEPEQERLELAFRDGYSEGFGRNTTFEADEAWQRSKTRRFLGSSRPASGSLKDVCTNCGHAEPHNAPAGDVNDGCSHPCCNCGFDSRGDTSQAAAGSSQPEEQKSESPFTPESQLIADFILALNEDKTALRLEPAQRAIALFLDAHKRASQPEGWQPIAERIAKLAHWEVADNLQALRTRLACIGAALKELPPAPAGAPGAQT